MITSVEKKVNLLVDYVLCEGNDTKKKQTIVEELRNLRFYHAVETRSVKKVTEDFLTELGMPSHISGYDLCVLAIVKLAENYSKYKNNLTSLYVDISKEYYTDKVSTSYHRAERSIRHAVSILWSRGNLEMINKVFKSTVSPYRGQPTNSEFLFRVAQLVKREMGE